MSNLKPYIPMCSLVALLKAKEAIEAANTADELKKAIGKEGVATGYRAFCYLATGKLTAWQMKPAEASAYAAGLEAKGQKEEALAIYQDILKVHPDHAIAKAKVK